MFSVGKSTLTYKKIALALSLGLILLWITLGTSASLAWFTDTSPTLRNIFHIQNFDLIVSHKLEDGTYEELDGETPIFDDEALYEPGYVQVVWLKAENRGDSAFNMKTAVNVTGYVEGTNVFGRLFNLQDYLRFGLESADTESELQSRLANRMLSEERATMPLNNYSTDKEYLEAGGVRYMALIVRMPKDVGNEANYRLQTVPRVELGVIVTAEQIIDNG